MNCLAWRGVKARPLRNVNVCNRLERRASTSSASTSSRVVPSRGRSPSRPSRRRSCSRSFSACVSPVRTRAWSSRARCLNRLRTNWDRHSSFLFLRPYFFRSSFSALIRSASHGWEGRSYLARENFGSPNDSLLLLFLLLFFLFFLLLFLLAAFLGLLRLGGFEGGLLRDPDGQARPAVRPGTLAADLLPGLMADTLVGSDHLHPVDVVPSTDLHVRAEEVNVDPALPVLRAVHHPGREEFPQVAEGLRDLVRLRLRKVPEPLRAGHGREFRDGLRDADPDARDRREGVRHGPRAIEVRVRHPHDVPEVLLHALEFLRRPRGLRLLLLLFLLLRRLLGLLALRGWRWALRFRGRPLLRHSTNLGRRGYHTAGRI